MERTTKINPLLSVFLILFFSSCNSDLESKYAYCSNGNIHSQVIYDGVRKSKVIYFDCIDGKLKRKDIYDQYDSSKKKVFIYSKEGLLSQIKEYEGKNLKSLYQFKNNRLNYMVNYCKGVKSKAVEYYLTGSVKSITSKLSNGAVNASINFNHKGHVIDETSFFIDATYDAKKENVYLMFCGQKQYDSIVTTVYKNGIPSNELDFMNILKDTANFRTSRYNKVKIPIEYGPKSDLFTVLVYSYYHGSDGYYYCRENWFQLQKGKGYPENNSSLIK